MRFIFNISDNEVHTVNEINPENLDSILNNYSIGIKRKQEDEHDHIPVPNIKCRESIV